MITKAEFRSALKAAAGQLREVSKALAKAALPALVQHEFTGRELTNGLFKGKLDCCPRGYAKAERETDFIYLFQVTAGQQALVSKLVSEVERAHAINAAVSRINRAHADSTTLYVGRSRKLYNRVLQHFGGLAGRTFALRLGGLNLPPDLIIHLTVFRFDREDDLFIQALEDGLWVSLRPVFGRKGAR